MTRRNPWDNPKDRETIMAGIRLAASKRGKTMTRRATFTAAELARAVKVAKQEGAARVVVKQGGQEIAIELTPQSQPPTPPKPLDIVL